MRQASAVRVVVFSLWALAPAGAAHAQTVTTVAGGYIGDGEKEANAALNFTPGIAQDQDGNYYVSDLGANRIRKIGKNGKISTIAGTGTPGYNGNNIPAV